MPSAISVYRRVLAAEEEGTVVIASTGFLTNLHELLLSPPDEFSPLSGQELIRRKVHRLVVMGGAFPKSTGKHGEFNFVNVNEDGRYVADYWPTPILFTGFEVGEAIQTGTILATTPFANPARRAYELYPSNDGMALTRERPSWDQTAVLAAVRAPELYWRVESGGRCVIHLDGHNEWKTDPDARHAYLVEQMPAAELARLISEMMAAAPGAAT